MVSPSEGWAVTLESGTSIYHYRSGVWTQALSLPIGDPSISLASSVDIWVSVVLRVTRATKCHTNACYAEGDHAAIYHYNGSTWAPVASMVTLSAGKSGMSETFIYDGLASGVWFTTQSNATPTKALIWTRQGGDWASTSPPLVGFWLDSLTADRNGGMWAVMRADPTNLTQPTIKTMVLYTQGTTWPVYGHN